ncbi:MAG: PilZ domain-containing protein [Roseburia sp.]
MKHEINLKNCRALIRNKKSGQTIADTKITDFDSRRNLIKIRSSSLMSGRIQERVLLVSVLIFTKEMLLEYNGRLRMTVTANELEIELSARREREDRESVRYTLEMEGKVEGLLVKHQKIFLRKPIDTISINISERGLLLCAAAGSFEIGDCVIVFLQSDGMELRGEYEVVRTQNSNLWTEEYGCRLVEM